MNIVELPDGLKHVSIFLRRVALNVPFLRRLRASVFFQKYFSPVLSDANSGVVQSGLLIVKTVAQIGYVKDLDDTATAIVDLVKTDMKGITTIALNIGKTLCSRPKCGTVFERLKFRPTLKATRRNQEYTIGQLFSRSTGRLHVTQ
jgi:hypothetical protein